MRAVIQRVSQASIRYNNEELSRINAGFLVLVAVKVGDSEAQVKKMAEKIAQLRIIEDEEGKMNLSLIAKKQSVLLVSQFTLYGDCQKGNRPSFMQSARPEEALPLFKLLQSELQKLIDDVQLGVFGEYMQINLTNEGPTTIVLDT
ncbi:D-tyrosyl-tRNA(Tyr) deacylase [Patescibacteria group bacterium]|nr:D-tyrosyl-tRNA(Tyr) deacylase [Patescibacteria group bacterium]